MYKFMKEITSLIHILVNINNRNERRKEGKKKGRKEGREAVKTVIVYGMTGHQIFHADGTDK